MQSFQTATISSQGPKNYVFVDEHNRHKRLKVMRACEGCRRRKIKCDAATTNSWPCAACKRLKLTCVPPVGGIEGEGNSLETNDPSMLSQPSTTPVQQFPPDQFHYMHNYGSQPDLTQSFPGYEVHGSYELHLQQSFQYPNVAHDQSQVTGPQQQDYPQHRFPSFDSVNGTFAPHSVGSPHSAESVTAEELAENLGDLRIGDSGIAPYIRQQNSQNEPPAPIIDDDEEDPPDFRTMAGSQVRIPPALMPSDEEASQAFQDFFKHVHPYVPVLCRSQFYHQWKHDRHAISPLLLEAVLACAGQVSDDPAGGSQWLALANRHEPSFVDTPRLSTVQALLLLLKAREKTPKRGYFYRSWILVKKIVGMAKDLDLHEHHDVHRSGGKCDSLPADCLSKTRIWQLSMAVELMVGGPQGRSDFGVDLETVDVSLCPPNADVDEYEKSISRHFASWIRNVRNIRGITETYHKLRRKNKDWASDPKFLAYNDDFRKWPTDIPKDLSIPISTDGSTPDPPSHFLANMHCHYQLGIVMLYKPQLNASKDFANDEKWRNMMTLCYEAAKQVCILQEATLKKFGILGLASMQRGLSFPIYAILSCVMVHLIAITSPDPTYNHDARDFFTRHMRLLEQCISEWPMHEVETQIRGLREAFSANLNKPFDLKPTFPYGTPSEQSKSPGERRSSEPQPPHWPSHEQKLFQQSMSQNAYFPTPPVSVGSGTKPTTPQFYHDYSNGDHGASQYQQMPPTSNPNTTLTSSEQWNPTPIIDQFNTAFAIPPSALAPPPPSSYSSSPPVTMPQQGFHGPMPQQQYVPSPTSAGGYSAHPYTHSPTAQTMPHPQNFMPPHSQTTPQPQMTPGHYPSQQSVDSYFDAHVNQQAQQRHGQMSSSDNFNSDHRGFPSSATTTGSLQSPVYVTPRQWQQSVASVCDPHGLKRKWGYDPQSALRQQAHHSSEHYASIG